MYLPSNGISNSCYVEDILNEVSMPEDLLKNSLNIIPAVYSVVISDTSDQN